MSAGSRRDLRPGSASGPESAPPGVDDMTVCVLSLARPVELDRTLSSIGEVPNLHVILNGADPEQYREVVGKHRGRVRFTHNTENLGVAAAFNQGIATADTRYVVLSGDDLHYRPGWAEMVLRHLGSEEPPLQAALSEPILFSSFMVDKALIAEQGWFDHNFTRIYYEDEDWKLRTEERLGLHGEPDAHDEALLRLGLVERPRHRRAPWNSIPNRVYFWRKWERLDEPTEDCLYLRPHILVRRRLPEPAWPHLEEVRRAYRQGDYRRRGFVYDRPGTAMRLLTSATTNRPVIAARKVVQRLTNPEQELR